MAYHSRKSSSRSSSRSSNRSSFRASDYVPLSNQAQTDAISALFRMVMAKFGVTDIPSYFDKLLIPIVVCMVAGAIYGGYTSGLTGFIWWGLAGVAGPAALVFLGLAAGYCLLIFGAFLAAWAVILCALYFLLGR